METKHTPLPWIYEHRKGDSLYSDSSWGKVGFWQVGSKNFVLGSGEGWDSEFMEPSEVDAEFIIRACNNHYELLAALESCLMHIVGTNAYEKAKTAIARAESTVKAVKREGEDA